jgi:WXG100 family type VII secretion target
MLKYNFVAIDGLCDDMQTRVTTLSTLKDKLQGDINKLGAQWEGGTSEAMSQAFTSLNNNITDLHQVIGLVKAAVEAGNSDMGATDANLAVHWHPGG